VSVAEGDAATTAQTAAGEWRQYWTLPVSAALGYSAAVLHTYSIGSFIAPLQQEFGWTRAQISAGITIAGLTGAALSVPLGMLVDRLGPRRVGLAGVLLMTVAFASLGTATGTRTNWLLLWSFVALANVGLQVTIWTSAIASRFEASRGMAFAVAVSGASVGATVFPLLATWLIGAHGWRTAFEAMGGVWLVLVFPIVFLFFRGAQDYRRVSPEPVADTLPGISVAAGLRLPAFYQLVLVGGLMTFAALGLIVHFVPILRDRGADPLAAAGVASLIGVFSIVGRVGTGLLLDHLPGKVVGAGACCLPVIACVLLLLDGSSGTSQAAAAACIGLTVGSEIDVIAYLASQHFGLKKYGVLFGVITGALALGVALGPLAAGAIFDHFSSYSLFLDLTVCLMAVSGVALLSLSRPAFAKIP
jgi:MFS family permease